MNHSSKLWLCSGYLVVATTGCAIGESNPFADDTGNGGDAGLPGDTGTMVPDTGSVRDTGTAHDTGHTGCVPTVSSGAHEDTDALCSDGIDNDCNGLIDCADPWCATVPACGTNPVDAGAPVDTGTTPGCVPTATHEDTDALCSDGIDNDCNGHTDCADYYCSRYTATVTVCGPHDAGTSPTDSGTTPTDSGTRGGCTPVLTINEVQTAGTGGAADEWVEIYNAGTCPASLTGYVIQYLSASGTSPLVRWTGASGDSIPGQGYVVIAGSGYTGSVPALGSLGSGSGTLAAAGGGVALIDAASTEVDSMGYGTASNAFVRGSASGAPASATSVGRIPDGSNTGNNASDFRATSAPTPGASNH